MSIMSDPYLPEERQRHGKALDALTEPQYAFVIALSEQQLSDPKAPQRAAEIAGYSRSTAVSLMRNPRVLAALHELTGTRLKAAAIKAEQVVEEIMQDPTHKDRGKTARWVLELAGHTAVHRQEINVTRDAQSADDMRKEIARLLQTVPGAQKLLTAAGVEIIDAEFEEVQLAPDGQPW